MFPGNHLHLKLHDVPSRKYHEFNNKEHKPAGKLAVCYTELMLLSNHGKKVSTFHHFTEFLLDLLFLAGSRFTAGVDVPSERSCGAPERRGHLFWPRLDVYLTPDVKEM